MKTLEKGSDKIEKICAILRDETLEPAQKEALEIIKRAEEKALKIIEQAERSALNIHEEAKKTAEKELSVFQFTLQQAAKQTIEYLREEIENKFFSENLLSLIEKSTTDPKIISDLINVIILALKEKGLDTDLSAIVSKSIDPRELNKLLMQDVLKLLKEKTVVVGKFSSGVRVKLNDKKITVDISEIALKELLSTYIARNDFRKFVFNAL